MATRSVEAQIRISAADRTAKAFNSVANRMNRIDQQAQRINRRQSVVATSMARSSAAATAAMARFIAPAAIGYGIANVARATSDLEQSLFGIEKKSGATADEMARMKAEILDLGKELPVSISEIAAAYERGAAAGIPLDELREFATDSVKVADAFEMTAEEVGNVFAGMQKNLGMTMPQIRELADVVNLLADSGIADEKDLVSFFDTAGPSMIKNWGLATDQVAALAATMVNLKLDANASATAMQNLTTRLLAPSIMETDGVEWLQRVVGDLDAFHERVSGDPQAALMEFLEGLEKLDKFDRAEALAEIVGRGYFSEIMALVGALDEYRRNLGLAKSETAKGGIDRIAQRRMELFEARLQVFRNRLAALRDAAGPSVLAGLTEGMDYISRLFDEWEREGNPFQHIQAGWAGMREGLDGAGEVFRTIGGALDDLGVSVGLFGDGDGGSLTATFEEWQSHAEQVVMAFAAIEKAVRLARGGALAFRKEYLEHTPNVFSSEEETAARIAETQERIDANNARLAELTKTIEDGPPIISYDPANIAGASDIVKSAEPVARSRPAVTFRQAEDQSLKIMGISGFTAPAQSEAPAAAPAVAPSSLRSVGGVALPPDRGDVPHYSVPLPPDRDAIALPPVEVELDTATFDMQAEGLRSRLESVLGRPLPVDIDVPGMSPAADRPEFGQVGLRLDAAAFDAEVEGLRSRLEASMGQPLPVNIDAGPAMSPIVERPDFAPEMDAPKITPIVERPDLGAVDGAFSELQSKAQAANQGMSAALSRSLAPAVAQSMAGANASLQSQGQVIVNTARSIHAQVEAVMSKPIRMNIQQGGGPRANVGKSMPDVKGE